MFRIELHITSHRAIDFVDISINKPKNSKVKLEKKKSKFRKKRVVFPDRIERETKRNERKGDRMEMEMPLKYTTIT